MTGGAKVLTWGAGSVCMDSEKEGGAVEAEHIPIAHRLSPVVMFHPRDGNLSRKVGPILPERLTAYGVPVVARRTWPGYGLPFGQGPDEDGTLRRGLRGDEEAVGLFHGCAAGGAAGEGQERNRWDMHVREPSVCLRPQACVGRGDRYPFALQRSGLPRAGHAGLRYGNPSVHRDAGAGHPRIRRGARGRCRKRAEVFGGRVATAKDVPDFDRQDLRHCRFGRPRRRA